MGQNLLVSVTLIIFSVHLILGEEFTCPRSRGYYPHPTECKKYYSCRKLVSTLKECPEEMLFDVKKGNCYINSAVDCGSRKKPSVTVVTMAEIREENGTEGSWNTHSLVVTETSIAPSEDSNSSAFPLKDNTSKITTISTDNEFNSTTNETNNPNYSTPTTGIPDTEHNVSEIIVDVSKYTMPETSTDSKRDDLYTTENHLDNSNESTNGNKVTDVGELNITLIASTEANTRNGEYGTTENGVNDTSFVFTDYQDSSTISSQKVIVDDSNSTVTETSTESNEENIYTTVKGRDNSTEAVSGSTIANEVTDKGESNVTSIVSTEPNTRTSVEHESLATTEDGLNYTSILFTDYLNNLTASSSPHPYTDNTDFWNGTSDANDSITVATEITTKSVDESSVSYLWNVTEEPDSTKEGSEKSTTVDEESTTTTKLDGVSTVVSSSTDLSHKEYATTEKEVGSTSSRIVSDGVEINTTSSNEGIVGSTAKEPDEVITRSSTESTSHVSTKKVTTEQHTTITDDYYENDFDCPTPYGRYPHPTDKHKFLHCQEWFPHVMVCPADLIFDEKLEICVWSKASFIMY